MWNSGRVTMHDGPDGLDIFIRSKRDANLVVFLVLGFAAYFWLLFEALRSKDLLSIFVQFAFSYFMARAVLWTAVGCERISLCGKSLTVRFQMPGVSRTSSFDLSNVDGFRIFKRPVVQRLGLFMMYPDHRGRIIFDYNGKVHAFGVDLPQIEAEQVIRRIKQYDSGPTAARMTAEARI
jgi:hypothetical protein